MNDYKYEEIVIGHVEEFAVQLDMSKMDAFSGLTGDVNPLHTDETYASEHGGHKGRVAYGMLTASFLSTLAGMYLPGRCGLIQSVEVKFAKPVYPPEILTIRGEVTGKEDKFKLLKIKAAVYNGSGEKVLRAVMNVAVTDDE